MHSYRPIYCTYLVTASCAGAPLDSPLRSGVSSKRETGVGGHTGCWLPQNQEIRNSIWHVRASHHGPSSSPCVIFMAESTYAPHTSGKAPRGLAGVGPPPHPRQDSHNPPLRPPRPKASLPCRQWEKSGFGWRVSLIFLPRNVAKASNESWAPQCCIHAPGLPYTQRTAFKMCQSYDLIVLAGRPWSRVPGVLEGGRMQTMDYTTLMLMPLGREMNHT
jgi:hypothetical protein